MSIHCCMRLITRRCVRVGRERVVSTRINDRQLRTASFPPCLPAIVRVRLAVVRLSVNQLCPSLFLLLPPLLPAFSHRFLSFRSWLFSLFPSTISVGLSLKDTPLSAKEPVIDPCNEHLAGMLGHIWLFTREGRKEMNDCLCTA